MFINKIKTIRNLLKKVCTFKPLSRERRKFFKNEKSALMSSLASHHPIEKKSLKNQTRVQSNIYDL